MKRLKSRFQYGDLEILIINKSGQYSDLFPIDKLVDYKIRESRWNLLVRETKDFLEKNQLNIEDYKLID